MAHCWWLDTGSDVLAYIFDATGQDPYGERCIAVPPLVLRGEDRYVDCYAPAEWLSHLPMRGKQRGKSNLKLVVNLKDRASH